MNPKDDNPVKEIIDQFFQNASPEEIHELNALLDKQRKKKLSGGINPDKIASGMADDLRRRMGLTTEQINRTARDAVRTMILQYDPNIREEEIRVLLDRWVPDPKKKKKLPADLLHTMIVQFAAYGTGELTEEQLSVFPEGWTKKYWESFPVEIQKLISAFIKGRINKYAFIESVENILKNY